MACHLRKTSLLHVVSVLFVVSMLAASVEGTQIAKRYSSTRINRRQTLDAIGLKYSVWTPNQPGEIKLGQLIVLPSLTDMHSTSTPQLELQATESSSELRISHGSGSVARSPRTARQQKRIRPTTRSVYMPISLASVRLIYHRSRLITFQRIIANVNSRLPRVFQALRKRY